MPRGNFDVAQLAIPQFEKLKSADASSTPSPAIHPGCWHFRDAWEQNIVAPTVDLFSISPSLLLYSHTASWTEILQGHCAWRFGTMDEVLLKPAYKRLEAAMPG